MEEKTIEQINLKDFVLESSEQNIFKGGYLRQHPVSSFFLAPLI